MTRASRPAAALADRQRVADRVLAEALTLAGREPEATI